MSDFVRHFANSLVLGRQTITSRPRVGPELWSSSTVPVRPRCMAVH